MNSTEKYRDEWIKMYCINKTLSKTNNHFSFKYLKLEGTLQYILKKLLLKNK